MFRRDLQWLEECELLVAEASGSTYGVGFEVGYVLARAQHTGQRVLLLYDSARRDVISRLIAGNDHASCTTFGYGDLDELSAFLQREIIPSHQPSSDP